MKLKHIAFLMVFLLPLTARAACSGPTGAEGATVYNSSYHVMQFCNGTQWVSMAGGTIVYSAGGSTTPVFSAANGYFVLTNGTWTGNLGGLSGADAKCLSDLTSNNWNGKSAASGYGVLNSTHVHAFMCDSTQCNMPTGAKDYYFATSGDVSAGGGHFTTDSGGFFAYDQTANCYVSDGVQWSALSSFNTSTSAWAGVGFQCSNETSSTPNSAYNCQNWTDATTSYNGAFGNTSASDSFKFTRNYAGCNAAYHLMCFVNP